MPLSDDERRKRDRERKARQRAAKQVTSALEALPQIGPGSRAKRGTQGGTEGGTRTTGEHGEDYSNHAAAREAIAALTVPASAKWRVALVMSLARDLDQPNAVPQRAGLASRYTEALESLIADAKPRVRDELDDLRFAFYRGQTDGIDDDPEAPKRRAPRKKA